MADPMHILVTGGAGQVGVELQSLHWPDGVVIHAPGRDELDLAELASIRSAFARAPYAAVINCGAWTAVDQAESEVTDAFKANALGPAALADLTRAADVPLIQVSTDYVFDGRSDRPYVEEDATGPLGVYGASKLAGEWAVRRGNPRSVILRTAWIVSAHRSNFLKTMLRLASEQSCLHLVDDQHGCPTGARDIATVLGTIVLRMIADPRAPTGVYHFVNAGETTWAGLAEEILERSAHIGGPTARIEKIATAGYPTPARRPANSRLSIEKLTRDYGVIARPWQSAVAETVAELHTERSVL